VILRDFGTMILGIIRLPLLRLPYSWIGVYRTVRSRHTSDPNTARRASHTGIINCGSSTRSMGLPKHTFFGTYVCIVPQTKATEKPG